MYWHLYLLHFSPGAAYSCLAGPCRRQRASFSCTGEDSHWENGGVDPAELQCLGQASEAVRPGLLSAGAASLFNQGTTLQSHKTTKGHESTFSPDSCHIYNVLSSYGVDFKRPCTIHMTRTSPDIYVCSSYTHCNNCDWSTCPLNISCFACGNWYFLFNAFISFSKSNYCSVLISSNTPCQSQL